MQKLTLIALALLFAGTTKPAYAINFNNISPEQKLILASVTSCLAARQFNDTCTKSTLLVDAATAALGARAAIVFWIGTPHRNGAPDTTKKMLQQAFAITCLIIGQNGSNLPRELSNFAKNWKEGLKNTSWKERIEMALRYTIPTILLINA